MEESMALNGDNLLWIFGYGSLIWKPDFPYVKKKNGYVKNYKRRFWQGSTDHRGYPGSPGRVVTLIPTEGEMVFGTAFGVDEETAHSILEKLDHREKGGYERDWVDLYDEEGNVVVYKALLYIASTENENYLGPSSFEDIGRTIAQSVGPSGPNIEYYLNLRENLIEMNIKDSHLEAIYPHVVNNITVSPPWGTIYVSDAVKSKLFVDGITIEDVERCDGEFRLNSVVHIHIENSPDNEEEEEQQNNNKAQNKTSVNNQKYCSIIKMGYNDLLDHLKSKKLKHVRNISIAHPSHIMELPSNIE